MPTIAPAERSIVVEVEMAVTCVLQKMSGGAVSNTPSCLNINWRSLAPVCPVSVSSLLGQKGIFLH